MTASKGIVVNKTVSAQSALRCISARCVYTRRFRLMGSQCVVVGMCMTVRRLCGMAASVATSPLTGAATCSGWSQRHVRT